MNVKLRDNKGRFITTASKVIKDVKETIEDIVNSDPDLYFSGYPTELINKESNKTEEKEKPKPETVTLKNKGKDKRQIALESLAHSIFSKLWPIVKTKNFIIGVTISALIAWIF